MISKKWNSIECIVQLIIMIQSLRFIINGEKRQIKLYINHNLIDILMIHNYLLI